MNSAIVDRAKEIIFSMEGNYGSVCINDCGALSIGCVQWHGERAKSLLQTILKMLPLHSNMFISTALYSEIMSKTTWKTRVLTEDEKWAISKLLTTTEGKTAQNNLANLDIQGYINHVASMGFSDEETIIFLADIENQGGAGASTRIGKAALKKYGQAVTLENVLNVACNDSVFSKYKARRQAVYNRLTNNMLLTVDGIMGKQTIKALQKFLKIGVDGTMSKDTIKALQKFLNLQI